MPHPSGENSEGFLFTPVLDNCHPKGVEWLRKPFSHLEVAVDTEESITYVVQDQHTSEFLVHAGVSGQHWTRDRSKAKEFPNEDSAKQSMSFVFGRNAEIVQD